MPSGKLETLQDCQDFVRGCLFMGTGGGGSVEWGMGMFEEAFAEGLALQWVDADSIPDDALTVTPYGMGSIAPQRTLSPSERRELGYGDWIIPKPMVEAVRELESYTGYRIEAIVPFELGAGNTTAPADAALP